MVLLWRSQIRFDLVLVYVPSHRELIFRLVSGDVSSVCGLSSGGARAVLLSWLAGDSRVHAATSVAVTGVANLHRFAQLISVSLQFVNGVHPKMPLSDVGGGDFPQIRIVSGPVKCA